jgi:hypothetical protein
MVLAGEKPEVRKRCEYGEIFKHVDDSRMVDQSGLNGRNSEDLVPFFVRESRTNYDDVHESRTNYDDVHDSWILNEGLSDASNYLSA